MFWNSTPKRLVQPRRHHYLFAHQVIREVCASDPLQFFAVIASDEQAKFVAWMWKEAERHAEKGPEGASLRDVKVATGRITDLPAVIMTMPATRAMAEAHLVAAVLMEKPTEQAPKPGIRYFTLEDGEREDGSPRTVLCEWSEKGHANYGDGPESTVQAFVSAIERLLK
jgi:hypothetical protein